MFVVVLSQHSPFLKATHASTHDCRDKGGQGRAASRCRWRACGQTHLDVVERRPLGGELLRLLLRQHLELELLDLELLGPELLLAFELLDLRAVRAVRAVRAGGAGGVVGSKPRSLGGT
eukprot:SAG22_NODE_3670_length_1584_cov_1.645118_2_plen_119_part_00